MNLEEISREGTQGGQGNSYGTKEIGKQKHRYDIVADRRSLVISL